MAVNLKKKINWHYSLHFKWVPASGNVIDQPQVSKGQKPFGEMQSALSAMKRGSEAFETAEWQHREYWNLFFSLSFLFFPLSLYSKSTDYALFYICLLSSTFCMKGRWTSQWMPSSYLPATQTKWKSHSQGTRSPYHSNTKGFQTAVIVLGLMAEGPNDSSLFPGGDSPPNTPVKELPNPCAWNFYFPGHCSLVEGPTWASGKEMSLLRDQRNSLSEICHVLDAALSRLGTEFSYFSVPYFRQNF